MDRVRTVDHFFCSSLYYLSISSFNHKDTESESFKGTIIDAEGNQEVADSIVTE